MWSLFMLALLVTLALLVVPGFLAARILPVDSKTALLAAPPISLAIYVVMGLVCTHLHVDATPWNMAILPSGILALGLLIKSRSYKATSARNGDAGKGWLGFLGVLALYLIVGIAMGTFFFLRLLPSPDVAAQAYDVTAHYGSVRSMVESHVLDPFHSTLYVLQDQAFDVMPSPGGFYPSVWHLACALVVMTTDATVGCAINAVNFTFAFMVFPMGMLLLLKTIAPDNTRAIVFGSIGCLSIFSFPWILFVWGPLFPNMAGFCLLPTGVALLVTATRANQQLRQRLGHSTLFLMSCVGIATLHPNIVFSLGLMAVPWLAHRMLEQRSYRSFAGTIPSPICTLAFLLLCCAAWFLAWRLPPLQSTVTYVWPPYATPRQELINILELSYTKGHYYVLPAHIVPAALVAIGAVHCAHTREHRWLLVAYLLAALLVTVTATATGTLRSLLTGFWYTDAFRVSAMAAIAAIPLLCLGAASTLAFAERRLLRRRLDERSYLVPAVCGVAYLALSLYPGISLPGNRLVQSPLAAFAPPVQESYLPNPYEGFLAKVSAATGNDLIINDPYDGSIDTYGLYGMRVYYRYFAGYGTEKETPESILIRTRLDQIAYDPDVRAAVDAVGARYVMALDENGAYGSFTRSARIPGGWDGIRRITDKTPGFTLMLMDGPCRLYRIDD